MGAEKKAAKAETHCEGFGRRVSNPYLAFKPIVL